MTRFNWKFYRDFTVWAEGKLLAKAKAAATGEDWAQVAQFGRDAFGAVRLILKPVGDLIAVCRVKGGILGIFNTGKALAGYILVNGDPFRPAREAVRACYQLYGDAPASYKPLVTGFGATDLVENN